MGWASRSFGAKGHFCLRSSAKAKSRRSSAGPLLRRQPPGGHNRPAPLDGLRSGRGVGRDRLGEATAPRSAGDAAPLKNSYASKPGRGRRTSVRSLRLFGDVVPRPRRQRSLEREWKPYRTRLGWGTAFFAGAAQGQALLRQRQRRALDIDLPRKANGKTIWEIEREEPSNWSTPFIWENEKRTEIVTNGRKKIRSYDLGRQAAVGNRRYVVNRHPDAVQRARAALSDFRVRGRPEPPDIRRETGSRRRYLAQRGVKPATTSSPGITRSRAVQPVAAALQRPLLHAAGPRIPDLPRRPDGRIGLRPSSASKSAPRRSHRVHGRTTTASSA